MKKPRKTIKSQRKKKRTIRKRKRKSRIQKIPQERKKMSKNTMTENSLIINLMERAHISGKMEDGMKENGVWDNCMEKANLYGLMTASMLVSTNMIIRKVLVNFFLRKTAHGKELGRTGSRTVMARCSCLKLRYMKGYGKMVKETSG